MPTHGRTTNQAIQFQYLVSSHFTFSTLVPPLFSMSTNTSINHWQAERLPLKFTPWLRPMIWGGSKISHYKKLPAPIDGIGESWEISAVPGHESVVAEGEFKGVTLGHLLEEYKELLVGRHVYAT